MGSQIFRGSAFGAVALVFFGLTGCGSDAPRELSRASGGGISAPGASGGHVNSGGTAGGTGDVPQPSTLGGTRAMGGAPSGGTPAGGSSPSQQGGAPGTGGGSQILGGSGNSGGSAGSGNQGVPYQPCPPAGTPCVILPIGDSITEGVGSLEGGGYRAPLFHLAHAANQSLTFVGSMEGGPDTVDGVPFPAQHEGSGGAPISEILTVAQTTLAGFNPNIVLLMIGTNSDGVEPPARAIELGGLLDTMVAKVPNALIVVAQITPTTDPSSNTNGVEPYNALLPAVVKVRTDAGKHLVLVNMYSAFTANANFATAYFSDAVHPNDAGYAVMASVWYGALTPVLR